MKKLFIVIFALLSLSFSQNYSNDSLIVRTILDSNGLKKISVDRCSDSSGGRIIKLNLTGMGISSIPPEIGQLKKLKELTLESNRFTFLPPEIVLMFECP